MFMSDPANADRVDIRLPRQLKERIRKIAAQTGRSMSDFIITAITEKVDATETSIERWQLDEDDSRIVMDLLTQPRDNPELRALMALTASESPSAPATT